MGRDRFSVNSSIIATNKISLLNSPEQLPFTTIVVYSDVKLPKWAIIREVRRALNH